MEEGHIGDIISIALWVYIVYLALYILALVGSLFPQKDCSERDDYEEQDEYATPVYEGRKAEELHYRLCESEKLRNNPKYKVFLLYFCREDSLWCVIDNSEGKMVTEFFKTKPEAEKWLYGK